MSKIVTWAIVIIVVVGGIWYVVAKTSAPAEAPSGTGAPTASTEQNTANTGTSDADLDRDLLSADAQMQAASSAGLSAQTFSDTQVAQTE